MRVGVVAGEASGDILGAGVLASLKEIDPYLRIEGIGGPLMEAQGLSSMFPMDRLSVMGFVEPLKRLPELLRIRRAVYRHFRDSPPDIFLGIDAPDFNLGLERKLRRRGVRTAHLVSPTVWAWRQWRLGGIRRAVDLMLCLFPFELPIYRENGVPAVFVGHPMADEMPQYTERREARGALGLDPEAKLLALLPGSRGGEVRLLAPVFLQTARLLRQREPRLEFVLPAASGARARELRVLLGQFPDLPVSLLQGRSREAMTAADAVLLASGTASLEAALLKRPMVVAYRLPRLSWWLMSRLATTRFVALPNVLAGRELVPELLQDRATPKHLAAAMQPLLAGAGNRSEQVRAFAAMHDALRRDFAATSARALMHLAGGGAGDG